MKRLQVQGGDRQGGGGCGETGRGEEGETFQVEAGGEGEREVGTDA